MLHNGIPNSPKSIPAAKGVYVRDKSTLYLYVPSSWRSPISWKWESSHTKSNNCISHARLNSTKRNGVEIIPLSKEANKKVGLRKSLSTRGTRLARAPDW